MMLLFYDYASFVTEKVGEFFSSPWFRMSRYFQSKYWDSVREQRGDDERD